MLLVIAGAGASYDSVPSRPPPKQEGARSLSQSPADSRESRIEECRPPLADSLFLPCRLFEESLREMRQVLPIAPFLADRPDGHSVEDVLTRFADEAADDPRRTVQLAAVRFYLQSVIDACEGGWYRGFSVPTNMMALIDEIEHARRGREHAAFVTFNYDRLIEHALTNLGQPFSSLPDYVSAGTTNVFKLHGSVDWARPIAPFELHRFGGTVWDVARQIAEQITSLPPPGSITLHGHIPSSRPGDQIALPAIAIPVNSKSTFECPEAHVAALQERLKKVRAILTVGWRGGEEHFLRLLAANTREGIEVVCVGGSSADADATIGKLSPHLRKAHYHRPFGGGFSDYIRQRAIVELLGQVWEA